MMDELKPKLKKFGIALAIIGILLLSLVAYVSHQRTILYTYVQEPSNEANKKNDFYVEIITGKNWPDDITGNIGAQYDGSFYNNTKIPLINWRIEYEVPKEAYSDSNWNGVYNKKGNVVSVTAVSYNIKVHQTKPVTFGFVMYTDQLEHLNHIKVSAYKDYKVTDFNLFWILMAVTGGIILFFIEDMVVTIRMRKVNLKQEEYKNMIMQSLRTFANIIDAKDSYTRGHSLRVARYAEEISRRMGKSQDEQTRIFQISLLHDIGKIAIDNTILNKPGKLTKEEHLEVQKHASIGGDILKDFTTITGIEDGARFHHESYNGTGYPDGLSGDSIPECARIICIADAFDAMDSDRCYRDKLPREAILKELERCSGTQFDPSIVKHVFEMVEEGFDASEHL